MASNSILASMSVALTANVSEFNRNISSAKKELAGFKKAGEQMKGLGEDLSKFLTAPIVGLGAVALKTFGDIEALKKGLQAVSGSAEEADKQFNSLKEVAKLPGLGLEEAVKGSVNLQAIGFSAEKAEKSIAVFGNAISTVGGGRQELERALHGLQQLANTDFPLGEDLNIIKEAIPQVTPLLKEAFGSARSEDLKKLGITSKQVVETITKGLERLPKVAGGVKNSFENLSDSTKIAFSNLGDALNTTLNFEGALNGLADGITGLSEGFAGLSGPVKTTIIAVAGLAAAAGPLIFAVGALSAAVPTLAAGFAVLTGPIGLAVVAFAALAAVAVSVFASSKKVSLGLDEQKKKVQDLDKSFVPLVDRYDQLKAKSKLSKDEQTELNSIIAQIAKTAPDTITVFDQYGKALDISSEKARGFVEAQRAIQGIKNKEVIQQQVEEFKKLDKELGSLQGKLKDGVAFETKTKRTADGPETQVTTRSLTNAERQELGFQIAAIQEKQNALRLYVRELNGLPPLLKQIAAAGTDANTKLPGLTEDQKKIMQELNETLAQSAKEYGVHDDSVKHATESAAALETAWKGLLKTGLSPQSQQVQKLTSEWKLLTSALDGYAKRGETIQPIDLGSGFGNPDDQIAKIEVPVSLKLLPVDVEAFKASLTPIEQTIADFSTRASAMINDLVVNSFIVLGESIGSALTGGGPQAFFDGFISMLSSFAADFGKLLITTSLAAAGLEATISNPALWPVGLAAGVALVAAAGAAKAFLSKGPGPAGSGASVPRSSSPQTYGASGGNGYGQNGFTLETKISGADLQVILNKTSYRDSKFGR